MPFAMKLSYFSYRFASEVLASKAFRQLRKDVVDAFTAIQNIPTPKKPKTRTRGGKTRTFTTNAVALNQAIDALFKERKWDFHPSVTNDKATGLQADFKKGRVQVEVQFGNMARWYTDVFKFQVSYSLDLIDVGILVVPLQKFANTIDENVAYYERVIRELPYAKMSITLPILVVGIEP